MASTLNFNPTAALKGLSPGDGKENGNGGASCGGLRFPIPVQIALAHLNQLSSDLKKPPVSREASPKAPFSRKNTLYSLIKRQVNERLNPHSNTFKLTELNLAIHTVSTHLKRKENTPFCIQELSDTFIEKTQVELDHLRRHHRLSPAYSERSEGSSGIDFSNTSSEKDV